MREKIETKPIITKQLAVDIWNASLKEVAEHDNQHDRVNVVGVLLDRAMTLNELTGCLADDPVGFFLSDAFDKRLAQREQEQRISSGEGGKNAGNRLPIEIPQKFFTVLMDRGTMKVLFQNSFGRRLVETYGKWELDNPCLYSGDDDLSRLLRSERIRILVG